jgi:hypothetical protein
MSLPVEWCFSLNPWVRPCELFAQCFQFFSITPRNVLDAALTPPHLTSRQVSKREIGSTHEKWSRVYVFKFALHDGIGCRRTPLTLLMVSRMTNGILKWCDLLFIYALGHKNSSERFPLCNFPSCSILFRGSYSNRIVCATVHCSTKHRESSRVSIAFGHYHEAKCLP